MEKYKFLQHVRINDKSFKQGIHAVPDEVVAHDDFLHFVRCGYIEEAPPQQVAAQPVSVSEHAKKLAERIEKKLASNQSKIKKGVEQVPDPVQQTKDMGEWSPSTEEPPIDGDADDDGGEEQEEHLTPQQRAARTRKANAAAKKQGDK